MCNSTSTENTLFAFKANIAFYGFQERCTTIRRELTDECYNSLSLPVDCYQCFSNWSATLIGFGNAAGITLDLVGKPTEPHVQIGVGANGKVCCNQCFFIFNSMNFDTTTEYKFWFIWIVRMET